MSVDESDRDIHNIVTLVKNVWSRPTVVDKGNVTCVFERESNRDSYTEFSSDEMNIKEDVKVRKMVVCVLCLKKRKMKYAYTRTRKVENAEA